MKKIAFIYLLILSISPSILSAQIYNPKEIAKRKASDRANGKVDQTIDKGLDKIEEGIGNIFKKKEKTKSDDKELEKSGDKVATQETESGKESSTAEQTKSENIPTQKGNDKNTNTSAGDKPKFSPTSKFDFVPGEKVIGFEDFSETAVGDFPLGWNTNSSAEIVTFEESPEKWLFMSQDGFFQPDFLTDFPENFTLEYDLFTRNRSSNILNYGFYLYASENPRIDFSEKYTLGKAGMVFKWNGGMEAARYEVYEAGEVINKNDGLIVKSLFTGHGGDEASKVHFSIWRQKNRLRVYIDQVKVLDIPQAFNPKLKYNVFKFGSEYMNYSNGATEKDEYMVTNVRYAVGAPDTRSKLITEGRFSTTGILFDVNSDRIKASSEGTLKEIAKVLNENPTVKIKIIGHTDADGADAANQTLSEKRAESVKNALAEDFGIAGDRMISEGKGESQLADNGETPQAKANNRRVEFVKL